MLTNLTSEVDQPLFQIQVAGRCKVLTDSVARKHLKRVSSILNLPRSLTFHDFRRGGATWAFLNGVPIQQIQAQGTWSSSCVWRYINLPPSAISQVSRTFQAHLSSSLLLLGTWALLLLCNFTCSPNSLSSLPLEK